MRPVPVCIRLSSSFLFFLSSMTVEPVRMNCPFSPRPSTAIRTASHNTGASCHSSISLGFVLAVARYPARLSGTCIRITLFACCKAVVVFPHHSPLRASYLFCTYSNTVCLTVILHILLFHLNLRTARGIQTEGGHPLSVILFFVHKTVLQCFARIIRLQTRPVEKVLTAVLPCYSTLKAHR